MSSSALLVSGMFMYLELFMALFSKTLKFS